MGDAVKWCPNCGRSVHPEYLRSRVDTGQVVACAFCKPRVTEGKEG